MHLWMWHYILVNLVKQVLQLKFCIGKKLISNILIPPLIKNVLFVEMYFYRFYSETISISFFSLENDLIIILNTTCGNIEYT